MILPSKYNPKEHEEKIYKIWEKSGAFKPQGEGKPFVIIMPPPNANGALHIGHAVFATLEDLMTRFYRMQGRPTLWLPGADHAGFETQVVFEKELEKTGKSRIDFIREGKRNELFQMMWNFTQKNKKTMENQLRQLGASCDWGREKFTLDKDIVKIVYQTFKKLYDDGLIYRAPRPVNWCTEHATTLSDLEVNYVERKDPLYYIKYGPLTLATVRPETKFGDTAVAVHPSDRRYRKYVGKKIEIETLIGPAKIEVIPDEAVDPKFGTGVVKVTPAHDPTDFEIGQRHNLEIRQVIDLDGKLNEKTGPYKGLTVMEGRGKVVEDMRKKGLIVKEDSYYTHTVATCYKGGTVIEPMVLPQWFVKMDDFAKLGLEAVEKKEVIFIPKRFEKVYRHWLENIRDWNISRQIVWGIRIPAWFRGKEIYVGESPPQGEGWVQDPDVFDTWFSSGQWPFATLKTTKPTDFEKFYPTTVMDTGWDIIFFWVARMIMLGKYLTGEVPFKYVYLHGLVRDKDRQKMSKSKGNVIDPLGVADLYGTDAVRMALVFGTGAGNDTIISEEKIAGMRNFANKIWNASRFVHLNLGGTIPKEPVSWGKEDKKEIEELKRLTKTVTQDMENFHFHQAAETLYHYFWHEFADKIIEKSKPRLKSDDKKEKGAAQTKLYLILTTLLKLLHPFMPFVTEAIWGHLGEKTLLISSKWPGK